MISIFNPLEFFLPCHFGRPGGLLDAGERVVLVMSVMTVVVVMGLKLVTVVMLVMVVMMVMGVKDLVLVASAGFAFDGLAVVSAARTSGCQGGKKREIFFLDGEGG